MTAPAATAVDVAHLQQWVGRSDTAQDTITPQLVGAFAATLDLETGGESGDAVPQLLHWCVAPPTVPMSLLGPDGHPARGGFLPPVPLPRRMWAAGRVWFHRDLRVGDTVERVSTIKSVQLKQGRTGALCFVVVEHQLSTTGTPAIVEEQHIVYRGLEAAAAGRPPSVDVSRVAEVSRTIDPSPVLLFRYSALTFNGHRIHYDRRYVTEVEGYPGLLVHGPLQATLLVDLASRLRSGERVRTFSFKATSPLFDGAPFTVSGRRVESNAADLWVSTDGGVLHMEARAEWS